MDEFIEESESAEEFSLDPTPEMSSESESEPAIASETEMFIEENEPAEEFSLDSTPEMSSESDSEDEFGS